jgi:hypothetical protein
MAVPTPDGTGTMPLDERVLAWFKRKLIDEPSTPVPEFRPNQRVFAREAAVRIVVPSEACRVHYTTDGTPPTAASPVWPGTLRLTETTTLKAMAVREGMRPSGVATTVFIKGQPPPAILGPASLPKAEVGQPYKVAFRTEGDEAVVWRLAAQYHPGDTIRYKGTFADFSGLSLDAASGVLSGTPTRPDVYTLQVQAARGKAQRAGVRTWVLHVLPGAPAAP